MRTDNIEIHAGCTDENGVRARRVYAEFVRKSVDFNAGGGIPDRTSRNMVDRLHQTAIRESFRLGSVQSRHRLFFTNV